MTTATLLVLMLALGAALASVLFLVETIRFRRHPQDFVNSVWFHIFRG